MITKKEIEEAGYEVLPKGGWIRISPENMPRDWEDVCNDFGVSSDCLEIILIYSIFLSLTSDLKMSLSLTLSRVVFPISGFLIFVIVDLLNISYKLKK